MFEFILINFKKGFKKINDNPQLIYTVIVAVLIIASFIFMSSRFVKIANDAQERLVNVRVGALQDAFVSFASDKMNDTKYLNDKIANIIKNNETIESFKVVVKNSNIENDKNSINSYNIIASNNIEEIGKNDTQSTFLFTLAFSDPNNSITTQIRKGNERFFNTTRAITDNTGNILGAVITTQSLSLADIATSKSIDNSILMLVIILILIMFLFLRHSRILDYMDLYKKLKEVNQMKDDFISMASHELRTPLSVIRGYAEFVSEAPEVSNETREYTKKIDISAKELDSLITDILDVSKIEQGRMSYIFEKINPSEIVSNISMSFIISAKEKGLNLSYKKINKFDNFLINIDISRLKQILINLIGNAVKYTLKGEIIVSEYIEDKRVYIKISDTGIGMSEDERKKLFEKFYRIKTKETENIKGTGLGLWITAQIIEQMKGKLSVESIKGVGSRFIVSFPINE